MISTIKTEEDICKCESTTDLAYLLNISLKTLLFLAYKNDSLYTNYLIKKKSGGQRLISAPNEALKTACKKLNYHLNDVYSEFLPKSAHGFIFERGIVTNAKGHLGRKYILNIDIEDFFQTINSGRIMGLFKRYPFRFGKRLRSVITGLVTYNNSLPQGSPCSPVLSNMVCLKLDKAFIKLAHKNGWRYSRYADDITISANRLTDSFASISGEEVVVGNSIRNIIEKNGFGINRKKTRLAVPGQSKWVTGVKVNKKLNVSRKRIRKIRCMLNAWKKYGEEKAEERFNKNYNAGKNKSYRQVLRGQIDHVGNVRSKKDLLYRRLHNRLCYLDGKQHLLLPESEREEYLNNVLVIMSPAGYGSGFFISKNIIITCAHVVADEGSVMFTTRNKKLPVEHRGASVIEVNTENDYAILYTVSESPELVFECNPRKPSQQFNQEEEYISVGYGGFRLDNGFWSEPATVDQRIVQNVSTRNVKQYQVGDPMWQGMSGGPVISKETNTVDGYISRGAPSLENSAEVRSFVFRPLSNIPIKYFDYPKEEAEADLDSNDIIIF